MAFFDDLGKKINDVSQKTVQKTKDVADIAKYSSLISEEEKKIKGLMEKIGEQYVSICGENPDETLRDAVFQVRESQDRIREYMTAQDKLKGLVQCPSCGASVSQDAKFCPICGFRMPEPEENAAQTAVMFCVRCGAPIDIGNKYCTSCGASVAEMVIKPEEAVVSKKDVEIAAESMDEEADGTVQKIPSEEKNAVDTAAEGLAEKNIESAENVFCTNCGAAIEAGSKFCVVCGTPVE